MTQLDPRIQSAIVRSRANHSPPAGCEDAMLAQFHARLGGPPAGGDGGVGGAGPSYTAGAQVVHALKIAAAVMGLTAAGLGGVALVGKAVRAARAPDEVSIDASVDDRVDTRPDMQAEPPAIVEASPTSSTPPPAEAPETGSLRRATPTRPAPASASTDARTTLAAELQLIQAARSAPPLQALELIDRHAEQFADGELSNEREGLRVIALCELGRLDEAQRASEGFIARSPGPLLMQKVSTRCREQIILPTTESQRAGNRSR
jgi:hypothetical protein